MVVMVEKVMSGFERIIGRTSCAVVAIVRCVM